MIQEVDFLALCQLLQVGQETGGRALLAERLQAALEEVAESCSRTGRKCQLKMVINVEKVGDFELAFAGDVSTKTPPPKAFPMPVYRDRTGRLTMDPGEQGKLTQLTQQGEAA